MNHSSTDDDLDTSEARSEILKRIRSLQSRPSTMHANELASAKGYLARKTRGPAPKPVDIVVGLFEERSKAMLCTVHRVNSESDAAQACADYLAEQQLAGTVAIWPVLKHLDWSVLAHESRLGSPTGDDLIGVSAVACAVAETGTLVFASKTDEPASTHLLPETHIAIVREDQVVHTMEDAFERLSRLLKYLAKHQKMTISRVSYPLPYPHKSIVDRFERSTSYAQAFKTVFQQPVRNEGRVMHRALNFVSGPSRTADIEQTIVIGAHGPYRVHLILVGKQLNEQ